LFPNRKDAGPTGFEKLPCVFASLREILHMQKLGKNHGGYHGETIDIRAVLRGIETAAQQHGWTSETFGRQGEFNLPALDPQLLGAAKRSGDGSTLNQDLFEHRHSRRRTRRAAHGVAPAPGKQVAGECGTLVLSLLESNGFRFEPPRERPGH
jgi:hypothetical protein